MKVGILTYHSFVNDGSVLQAYCLWNALRIRFPEARVEIVDYVPRTLARHNRSQWLRRRPPFFAHGAWARQSKLRSFLKNHVNFSRSRLVSDDLGTVQRFIAKQEYDLLVVGSDTVWELQQRSMVPSPPRNAYFAPGLPEDRQVALAVSCDPVSEQCFQQAIPVAEHFARFRQIFYRDETTRSLLETAGIGTERLQFCPDPTLLTSFESIVRGSPPLGRFDAAISIADRQASELVSRLLSGMGLSVLDLARPSGHERRILAKLDFGQRLGAFKNFKVFVSDRFHGSIINLHVNGQATIFYECPKKWPLPNSKGRDLFDRIGLSRFALRPSDNFPTRLANSISAWDDDTSKMMRQKISRLSALGQVALQQI